MINDFWSALPKIDETGIFIRAGMEAGKRKLPDMGSGLIDSAIVVASLESMSFIWTLDKKLLGALSIEQRFTP